jgi:hypothetical protein
MTYRVYYPLISRDGHRDFDTREAAEQFAGEMRNRASPYLTIHSWRRVEIVELKAGQSVTVNDLFDNPKGWMK